MAKINKYNARERMMDMISVLLESDGITINTLTEKYGFSKDIIIQDLNYIHTTRELGITLIPQTDDFDDEDDYNEEDDDNKEEDDGKKKDDDNMVEKLEKWWENDVVITAEKRDSVSAVDSFSLLLSPFEKIFLNNFLNEKKSGDIDDILIKNAPEYASKESVEILQKLNHAAKKGISLIVNYTDKERTSACTITPLYIVRMPADNLDYCMAFCDDDKIGYFRIDKLAVIKEEPLRHKLNQKKINREIELLDLRWGMGESEPFDFEMIVYNEADLAKRLKNELRNRKNAAWEELPDGKWLYKDKVIDFESLKTWVLGLGKSVKVLKPQKMADEILEDAKKRYEYYRKFFEVAENESSQPEETGKAD